MYGARRFVLFSMGLGKCEESAVHELYTAWVHSKCVDSELYTDVLCNHIYRQERHWCGVNHALCNAKILASPSVSFCSQIHSWWRRITAQLLELLFWVCVSPFKYTASVHLPLKALKEQRDILQHFLPSQSLSRGSLGWSAEGSPERAGRGVLVGSSWASEI